MRKTTLRRVRGGDAGPPARNASVERLRTRPGREPEPNRPGSAQGIAAGPARGEQASAPRIGAPCRRASGPRSQSRSAGSGIRTPGSLPVGRPHIPGCRAVAASVLEAVVALTSLHTCRIIFGCEPRAIPRQSEVAAARLRRRPVLPGSRGSARAARAGRRREPPLGSRRPGGGRRRCGCAARGSRSPMWRPGDRG